MLILTIPILAFFYYIASFDRFFKLILGVLLWVNILFVAYAALPLINGKQLFISFLIAIPITLAFYFGIIKLLDLGIKLCDCILKKCRQYS